MSYIDPASAAAAADKQPLEQIVDPAGDIDVVATNDSERIGGDDDGAASRQEVDPTPSSREAIANRFKEQRAKRQEQIAETPYMQLAADTAADGTADTVAAAETRQDAPRTIKVKVRHEERELPEHEVVAAAQKALAADDYLGEARKLLEDAKQLASSSPHQGREDAATTDRQAEVAADQSHQTDEQLADRLQFGLPEEAAEVIRQLRKAGTTDPDAIKRAVYDSQRNTDLTKANRAYEKFVSANEDLVKDPIAHAAMEAAFYNGLRTDLRNLGYTNDQLPQANERLVEAHRFHRIQGQDVRDTAMLLEDSKKVVEKFRGAKSGDDPTPKTQQGNNEVRVSLDRSERRNGIPQQPARSAIPNLTSTQPLPVLNARKNAMKQIAASGRRVISS